MSSYNLPCKYHSVLTSICCDTHVFGWTFQVSFWAYELFGRAWFDHGASGGDTGHCLAGNALEGKWTFWRWTLLKTNSFSLKIKGWKMQFHLGWPIFRGFVSFSEGIFHCYISLPGVSLPFFRAAPSFERSKGLDCNTYPPWNSSPLKMDGWKTSFHLGPGLFPGA